MKSEKGGGNASRDTGRQHQAPTGQTGKKPEDARGDPGRQERNREEMGVEEDHRTEDMQKGKRGTFP